MKETIPKTKSRVVQARYLIIGITCLALVSIGVFVTSAEPPTSAKTPVDQRKHEASNVAVPIATPRNSLSSPNAMLATARNAMPDRETNAKPNDVGGSLSKSLDAPKLDLTTATLNSNPPSGPNSAAGWLTLDRCPIFALETIELPAQDAGVITELNVAENQLVSAGQILGKQDSQIADLEKSVAALQAQVAAAEATDSSDVRLAQSFVEETQLQADIYEQMQARGTATEGDLRQRQLAAEQAKVKLTQSQSAQKQRELKSKLAQASLFLSQRKLERLSLVAPIQGIITRIEHHRGEWVPAGETILRIVRMDELKVDCLVDIHQVDPARLIDLPIRVTLNRRGFEGRMFSGRIASYDPDVSAAGMVRVHAAVQNQREKDHWLLLPGMSVTIQMQPVR